MREDVRVWLDDIQRAIAEAISYLPEKRDYFAFQKDGKTQRATERCIEIVGEAMSRILKVEPNFPIHHARQIVDTRNRIIHGYDSVSDAVIWGILTIHLPKLDQEIRDLLNP